ncbi:MAG: TolB family protein [Anaerolineae bacterium]
MEVGCEASVHTLVMTAATSEVRPVWPEPWESSFFLNWAPDGDALLVRVGHLGESAVFLVNVQNMRAEQMDTPPFTYDVAFSPNGRRLLYATTQGLGFGSEVWLMDRNGRNKERIIHDPAHIIAYPRWSPSGDGIAYIRMPDSNVPFTVGELVLADGDGRNGRVVAPADAGHGYPPVWSPDGRRVAFVVRENGEDRRADVEASALESNIYVVEVPSGRVRPVTQFAGALTDGPAWSPDGAWLAFSTNAGSVPDIWVVEAATGEMRQVTRNANARYPVWVAGSGMKGGGR